MRRMTTLRAVRLAAFASVLGGILSGAAALGACSSSDTPEEAAPDNDASSVIVPKDAADASDAADAADASDALLDAAPRVCSDDGFCHRPVPKGQNLRSVWATAPASCGRSATRATSSAGTAPPGRSTRTSPTTRA